jgi:hypothetical protein
MLNAKKPNKNNNNGFLFYKIIEGNWNSYFFSQFQTNGKTSFNNQ